MWCSADHQDLREDMLQTLNVDFIDIPDSPKAAYEKETLTVLLASKLSVTNETLWLALTSVDEHGVESSMSNLVSARFVEEIADHVPVLGQSCDSATIISCLADLYLYIIIAAAAFLLLMLVLVVAVCCCRGARNKSKEDKFVENDNYGYCANKDDPDTEAALTDLAQHDHIYMTHDQIITGGALQSGVSAKSKRISFKDRLSTLKRKSKPPPAPSHPVIKKDMQRKVTKQLQRDHQPNPQVVGSNIAVVRPQPVRASFASVLISEHNRKPLEVDEKTMPADIEYGEELAQNLAVKLSVENNPGQLTSVHEEQGSDQ